MNLANIESHDLQQWAAVAEKTRLKTETNMGPLVDRGSQQRVLGMIQSGKEEGATLHFGGNTPEGLEQGTFVNPTKSYAQSKSAWIRLAPE